MTVHRPRILSLFSGIGGLDVAVQRTFGGTVVAHCETNTHCQDVLARHWPTLHTGVIRTNEQEAQPRLGRSTNGTARWLDQVYWRPTDCSR